MNFMTLALLTTSLTSISISALAQVQPVPGSMPPSTTLNPSASSTQDQTARDAQTAQQNALQANPAQALQQGGTNGVFGPSAGPGIFGPTGQTTTTDVYGNQQMTSGMQANPQIAPGTSPAAQGTLTNPMFAPGTTDAAGNPLSPNGQVQNQLPRDLQPLTTPDPLNPLPPPTPSGTVTGR